MGITTHFVKPFEEFNKVSGKFYNTAGYIADTLFIIGGELYLKFYMEKSSVINSKLHGAFTDVYLDTTIIIETQKIFRSQYSHTSAKGSAKILLCGLTSFCLV